MFFRLNFSENYSLVYSHNHRFYYFQLKAIVNGSGKNALASPTHNVAEVYKISESEHVMSALEKDAPISKNVKPAGIASHQHQESMAYSKEQSSPTQTSVVKHSLLQFALQHFRYE